MNRALLVILASLLTLSACRRRPKITPVDSGGPTAEARPAQESAAAPVPAVSAAEAPLPPPDAELTPAMESRFRSNDPKQPFAPPQSGDYQAQLLLYNRVLRKWTQDQGYTPATLQDLQASFGAPKPPRPPTGRSLAYDRRTVSVSLQ